MSREGYGNYEDIINLPHPVSRRHPRMSPLDRAAQFSPFAALTGHSAAIRETGRLTENKAELDEDARELLDEKLNLLLENLALQPEIEVTYFQPDGKKGGGSYQTIRGRVQKIDFMSRRMLFADRTVLPVDDICAIEGELFRGMEDWGV